MEQKIMRQTLHIFLVALAVLSFVSCRKEFFDWAPVVLHFYIQDKDGNDLLDSSSASFVGDKITVIYKGEEYMISSDTKAYCPLFYGLDIRKDRDGEYYMYFGEFDGSKNYNDDFVIRFPDESSKTIHYDRKVNKITNSARKQWYLDGKRVETTPILIVY